METKEKYVHKYLTSLGWTTFNKGVKPYKVGDFIMGDDCFGDAWYMSKHELGFNTGSYFFLSFRYDVKIDQDLMIYIYEDSYGSWSNYQKMNQYYLNSIKELPTLMRFKGIDEEE